MDGLLLVKAIKIADDLLKLNFIKETRNEELILFATNTSITKFKSALLKSGKELVELNQGNWHSEDIEQLTKRYHYLSNI